LPVPAYQTESGTIIVQDDSENMEICMAADNQPTNVMSLLLKKTVEFSKNNATIEDFAEYIISNFSLKLNSEVVSPKYSKVKPKSEDIQKHFQRFMKPKDEVDKLSKIKEIIKNPNPKDAITGEELQKYIFDCLNDNDFKLFERAVSRNVETEVDINKKNELTKTLQKYIFDHLNDNDFKLFERVISRNVETEVDINEKNELTKTLQKYIFDCLNDNDFKLFEGGASRNVEITSQPFNYISSTDATSNSITSPDSILPSATMGATFTPTKKEIESAHEILGKVADELRSTVTKAKRGRKSFKKSKK
jgi:hypothetical protein